MKNGTEHDMTQGAVASCGLRLGSPDRRIAPSPGTVAIPPASDFL